ncbi:hypothetical protein EON63_03560 [archaeon]|nr:MAG: hypothetical protein EON63_03560 [archaeon]
MTITILTILHTVLNSSHFTSQHIYKLEWQPGARGYLHWYVDDEHVFGIQGSEVHKKTGAIIPVVSNCVYDVYGYV